MQKLYEEIATAEDDAKQTTKKTRTSKSVSRKAGFHRTDPLFDETLFTNQFSAQLNENYTRISNTNIRTYHSFLTPSSSL